MQSHKNHVYIPDNFLRWSSLRYGVSCYDPSTIRLLIQLVSIKTTVDISVRVYVQLRQKCLHIIYQIFNELHKLMTMSVYSLWSKVFGWCRSMIRNFMRIENNRIFAMNSLLCNTFNITINLKSHLYNLIHILTTLSIEVRGYGTNLFNYFESHVDFKKKLVRNFQYGYCSN